MRIISKIREARERMSGLWAIEQGKFDSIRKIYSDFEKNPKEFLINLNVQNINEDGDQEPVAFDDFNEVAKSERVLTVNGNEATVKIRGPLVDAHDCATLFFGCTSYEDIIMAVSEIEDMGSIENVIFDIDSPGGMVAGCDNAAIAIKGLTKKTEARVGIMAASAAYWLASQCDSITATSATASFGSIGVVVEYWDSTRFFTELGHDKICITSTNAPNKRVNALEDEGRRKIKADLDEIENIFLRRVAEGRNVTESIVAAKFGQGGMFLAEKSKSVGMIDKTDFVLNNNINSKNKTNEITESKMETLTEFLSKNPDAKKEIDASTKVAVDAAVKTANDKNAEEKKKDNEKIDKASKYLSSKTYSQDVKDVAIDVIKGEKSMESLDTVVNIADKNKESESSEAAEEETKTAEETTPDSKITDGNVEGDVTDEDSHKSAVERMKKMKG